MALTGDPIEQRKTATAEMDALEYKEIVVEL